MSLRISILTFFLLISLVSFSQVKEINLLDWHFQKLNDSKSYRAVIPGSVYLDLLKNKLIDNPYFENNEHKLAWVENETWKYTTVFNLTDEDLKFKSKELVFEGVDTYADIYLNNRKMASVDNMFRKWTFNASQLIKSGENKLEVIIKPVSAEEKKLSQKISYTLPGGDRVFTRKAQYQFGWDWAPKFLAGGIYKPVCMRLINDVEIKDLQVIQKELDFKKAIIQIKTEFSDSIGTDYQLKVKVWDKAQKLERKVDLKDKETLSFVEIQMDNPQLWWCNGMGDPHLYQVDVVLLKNGKTISTKMTEIGLRKIELVQKADSSGSSFYFKINGKPVFAKGANWVPLSSFPSEIIAEDYKKYLQLVKNAHMNMLRVWGGGYYEDDEFYKLCNEMGIMVWQDFMFACAMYPGDNAFVSNVNSEIEQQIRRLRNNPCLVLWCGNNENDEGWKNWGWQREFNYSKEDSTEIYQNYKLLFEKEIPKLISTFDSGRAYHPSSPTTGWGRKESYLQGDVHYWGVWWGAEPFEEYRNKVGRFVSEYGFQAMPSLTCLRTMTNKELSFESVKNHQKHPKGFETMGEYMKQDYKIPSKFEDYVYVSQLLQARGMEIAIEAHRKAMPYCMGTLFWQLNDCWPSVSWSCIDYSQIPKASYYTVKKEFSTVSLICDTDKANFVISVVNDSIFDFNAGIIFALYEFNGNKLFEDSLTTTIKAQSAEDKVKLSLADLKQKSLNYQKSLIKVVLKQKSNVLSEKYFYFDRPMNLRLGKAEVSVQELPNHTILVKALQSLAKNIFLEAEGYVFDDNFFDLLPGETKKVKFSKTNNSKTSINVKILNEFYSY